MDPTKIENIAKICHAALNAFSVTAGEKPAPDWESLSDAEVKAMTDKVVAFMDNPSGHPQDTHNVWRLQRMNEGWTYDPVFSQKDKKDPRLVGYFGLPEVERIKDHLFRMVIKGLLLW